MDTSLIVFTISALVYAVSLALIHIPIREFKSWGWSAFMHSITSIALIAVIPSIVIVRELIAPYIQPYIGVDISVGPETALAHLQTYQNLIHTWIGAVDKTALALGAMQAIVMLALTPAFISGVAVLFATIASYLLSAVFGMLIFIQKALSLLYLFSEAVKVFISFTPVLGPGMFISGLILYATPFARKLGKTLIVLGAGLTLALPPIIVAALPGPEKAQEEIEKTRELQAYSIALDTLDKINSGVRINIMDRNGTIKHINGGEEFHESRMIYYPYFKLKLEGGGSTLLPISCSDLPEDIQCEMVSNAVSQMLEQPESGFINSEQERIEEGYRTTLTMPEPAGVDRRSGIYLPEVWLLGLWLYMQGDSGKRDDPVRIDGKKLDLKPPQMDKLICNDITCWREERNIYEAWKEEWENYWQSTPQKTIYSENMVQEGGKTSLIWFTNRPVDSDKPLNIFIVYPGVQSLECRITDVYQEGNETKYKYGIFVKVSETPVTYFAYLDGAKYDVYSDMPINVREVDSSELSGRVVKSSGPLNLQPSIPATDDNPPPSLEASPPAHYMLVYLEGGEFQMGEGDTCEEAYREYLRSMVNDLQLEDNSTNPYVNNYRECYQEEISKIDQYLNSTKNESGNYTGPEIITEPNKLNSTSTSLGLPPCVQAGGSMPIAVTIEFNLLEESPLAPWKPNIEWEKFEKDEEYMSKLSSGGIVNLDQLNINVETYREEWDDRPIFKLGLYRDGPVHYGQRLVVEKLLEYKSISWTDSPIALMVYETFMNVLKNTPKTQETIQIPVADILISTGKGLGILDPLSKILGHTFALAISLIIFAVAVDTISGIIGGESAGKALLASPMQALIQAFHYGGITSSAIKKAKKVSILGYIVGKKREREMLKAAWNQRRDREAWRRIVESKIASAERGRFGFITGKIARLESKIGERLLDSRDRLGWLERKILDIPAKKYMLGVYRHGLLRDPEIARRNLDHARLLSQMKPVATSPMRFAQGAAYLVKNAPTRLERLALIDKLGRDTDIGKSIVWKSIGSWLSKDISRDIRAPAVFSLAADRARLAPGQTVSPEIPLTIPVNFKVGMVTRGLEHVPPPPAITRNDLYKGVEGVYSSVQYYDRYVRPLSPEEKTMLSRTLVSYHGLDEISRMSEPVVAGYDVNVKGRLSSDPRIETSFTIGVEKPEDIGRIERELLPKLGDFKIDSVEPVYLKAEDSWTRDLVVAHDYGPHLPRDLQEAFPWISGDAIDRFNHEGYSFSNIWSNITGYEGWWSETSGDKSSMQVLDRSQAQDSHNQYWGWWK